MAALAQSEKNDSLEGIHQLPIKAQGTKSVNSIPIARQCASVALRRSGQVEFHRRNAEQYANHDELRKKGEPFVEMENLDAKCGNCPTDDCYDDNAYILSRQIMMPAAPRNLPTATDMFPFGETADRICPPTTQSIKLYPII